MYLTTPQMKSLHPPCMRPSLTKNASSREFVVPTLELRWYYFGVESFWQFEPSCSCPHSDCMQKGFSFIPFTLCHLSRRSYLLCSLKISLLQSQNPFFRNSPLRPNFLYSQSLAAVTVPITDVSTERQLCQRVHSKLVCSA